MSGQNFTPILFATYVWSKKLDLFIQIMDNDIKQIAYNKSFIVFGLPLISSNFEGDRTKPSAASWTPGWSVINNTRIVTP